MKITHYLYNAFAIEQGGVKVAIDPGQKLWLVKLESLIPKSEWLTITHIVITHGGSNKGSRHEWHLLNLRRMTIGADVLSGNRTGFDEERVGLGAPLERSGFDTAGPVADPLLSNQNQQRLPRLGMINLLAMLPPSEPELQSVFETQLAWMPGREQRRLCHHEPNEIVGEQIGPHLLDGHDRGLTT